MIPKLQNCIDAIEEGGKQSTYSGWTAFHTAFFWKSLQIKVSVLAILREDGEKYYDEHE